MKNRDQLISVMTFFLVLLGLCVVHYRTTPISTPERQVAEVPDHLK